MAGTLGKWCHIDRTICLGSYALNWKGRVSVRSGVVSLKAALVIVLGLAAVVVSGRDQVLGQGGTWTAKAPMPSPRHGLAVGVVNGVLYAVGGFHLNDQLSTVEAYDPIKNTWKAKVPMPTARSDLAVGVVNGILYAVGGESYKAGHLATLEAYDPATDIWTAKAPMPTARRGLDVGVD